MNSMIRRNFLFVFAVVAFLSSATLAQVPSKEKAIAGAERAFEKFTKAYVAPAPGCAAAVSLNGETVFEKAFGLAELEHKIPNTTQTIFESGSVAKQFTAAAIVLLQQDGKLSLDDPVRKYIPELPDYGVPLTIRHLLNHTAGLRDWGTVLSLTGVGRGDRVINQDLALDVITHQRALDFTPGSEYSYSNSGYNLAAIIVERVSKQKFPAFVEERLFKPLGMKNSSWRDDYQRLVPGRAQGYSRQGNGPWRLNMPFMNVYGNGGMLTTVGDWMKWNAMLDSQSLGATLVNALETQGVLNDGRKISYALGLVVGTYKGLKDVSHGGATAGYQTFLGRYPDNKVSVGVLCNGTSPSAGGIAAGITDEIFGPYPETAKTEPAKVSEDELKKFVGIWRNEKTHAPARFVIESGVSRWRGGPVVPMGGGLFTAGENKLKFTFDKTGKPIIAETVDSDGEVTRFVHETVWTPTPEELASFKGEWLSEEAGATIAVAVEGDNAFIKRRPTTSLLMQPIYRDHFTVEGSVVWFTRDKSGKVNGMHVGASRMRDMPFVRVASRQSHAGSEPAADTRRVVLARLSKIEPKAYTDDLPDGNVLVSDIIRFEVVEPKELTHVTVTAYYRGAPNVHGKRLQVGDLVRFELPSEPQRHGILLADLKGLRFRD
ncbi:MAG TPA: serine hydrolase domain-containing protein [Pyrinomonadaceae bacterium]|nr:serine hydrolase domain-containing protein [Pyrinomonadaceae bacterium]